MRSLLYTSVAIIVLSFAGCAENNVTVDDSLKKYFDENNVTGTFGMFDNGQGSFTVYDLNRFKDSVYLPAATFDIVNSLIGIQTGIISNERMIISWDSLMRKFPSGDTAAAWNKSLAMQEAFKVAAVPYFQEITRRTGKDTMQYWLDTLGYGTRYTKFKIQDNLDTFWLDNTLKVTADEQVGLVKKLYFNQLPFQGRAHSIVKNLMMQENNANYKLSYKTGAGFRENSNALGWIVGWIEENQHVYFFALNIEGAPDKDVNTVPVNILKGILKQLGFFEGKK